MKFDFTPLTLKELKEQAQILASAIRFKENEELAKALVEKRAKMPQTKSYQDGYQTALNWKENYIPGGPFCFRPSPYESQAKQHIAQKTMDASEAWHYGFSQGIIQRNLTPHSYPPLIKCS